jgi:hypothetical protein
MERSALLLDARHPLVALGGRARHVGTGALALAVLLGLFDPAQFFRSYLVAFLFCLGIALGSMAILMLQYVTGGAWGAILRRPLESAAQTVPTLAVLFLPLVFGLSHLYEWARPDEVARDALLQHKSLYLNVPFFLLRAAVYFVTWIVLARFLALWSRAQDESDDPALGKRLHFLGRGGLLLYGFTMTFASIDWVMSLEPDWYSTIYGILFIGGQVLSAFAFVIPVTVSLADRPPLAELISPERLHDLGKLLLAFVMIWAYLAFSQLLIIWSANLPEETPWYLNRLAGGWQFVGAALILFHFALPFTALLSRSLKRSGPWLAGVALAVLAMRFLDLFWMIAPAFSPAAFSFHLLDPLALAGVGGIWLAAFVERLRGVPLVPLKDESLPLDEALLAERAST